MKLAGLFTYMAVVVGSESPKSDANPSKRILALGKHLTNWVEENLCRTEATGQKCLKAKTRWADRVKVLSESLATRYESCGSVPDRSRRRREEGPFAPNEVDGDDIMTDSDFDMLSSDDDNQSITNGIN